MKLKSGFEKRKARVEMLPLIDVVFLLLVFFIYAFLSMVVHRGVEVDLPAASAATSDSRDYLSVTLTQAGTVFINQEPVPPGEIGLRVRHLLAAEGDPDRPVFIEGDRRSELESALQILDQLRQHGIQQVSFSCTEPRN